MENRTIMLATYVAIALIVITLSVLSYMSEGVHNTRTNIKKWSDNDIKEKTKSSISAVEVYLRDNDIGMDLLKQQFSKDCIENNIQTMNKIDEDESQVHNSSRNISSIVSEFYDTENGGYIDVVAIVEETYNNYNGDFTFTSTVKFRIDSSGKVCEFEKIPHQ